VYTGWAKTLNIKKVECLNCVGLQALGLHRMTSKQRGCIKHYTPATDKLFNTREAIVCC